MGELNRMVGQQGELEEMKRMELLAIMDREEEGDKE